MAKSKTATKGTKNKIDPSAILGHHGLQKTQPRIEILKVFSHGHALFTAEEVFEHLANQGFDRTTIYRTLVTFEEAEIVSRIQLTDGIARYELKHSGHHHHHIICKSCKKIEVIHECLGEKLNKVGASLGFSNIQHSLEFYGLCPDCTAE